MDRTKASLLESDAAYFRRRAAEERRIALDSPDDRVRQVHDDMSRRYEDLARATVMFERHMDRQLEVAPDANPRA